MSFWLCAMVGVILVQRTAMKMTFDSSQAEILITSCFTMVGFMLSWIINMLYKSNRDTAIHEMGSMELSMFQAVIEEQIKARKGEAARQGNYDISLDREKKS